MRKHLKFPHLHPSSIADTLKHVGPGLALSEVDRLSVCDIIIVVNLVKESS